MSLRSADESQIHARFARAALALYGDGGEFEIPIPEGYEDTAVAAAFHAEGCKAAYLTPRGTAIVVPG